MEHGLIAPPLHVRYSYFLYNKKNYTCHFFSLDIGYANNGEQCRNRCQFYAEEFTWCWTVAGHLAANCTPTGE